MRAQISRLTQSVSKNNRKIHPITWSHGSAKSPKVTPNPVKLPLLRYPLTHTLNKNPLFFACPPDRSREHKACLSPRRTIRSNLRRLRRSLMRILAVAAARKISLTWSKDTPKCIRWRSIRLLSHVGLSQPNQTHPLKCRVNLVWRKSRTGTNGKENRSWCTDQRPFRHLTRRSSLRGVCLSQWPRPYNWITRWHLKTDSYCTSQRWTWCVRNGSSVVSYSTAHKTFSRSIRPNLKQITIDSKPITWKKSHLNWSKMRQD